MKLTDRLAARGFALVHGHNLVYNTCWEDPRLDREALSLGPRDEVLVITSAGCNALDYALDGPRRVHAVDLNFRQNALLELKIAGIRRLEHADFFELFGQGRSPRWREMYGDLLRGELSPQARRWWDRHIRFFAGRGWRNSFYFRGTAGAFARAVNVYIDRIARLRGSVEALLDAKNLETQRDIYDACRNRLWRRSLRWALGRDVTLALLGVPRQQRQHLERNSAGGIAGFIERCLDAVFGRLPLADNYFWRVYLTGQYTPECCPEYLRPANFARLKGGLVDRVDVHTASVRDFLRRYEGSISRFVLLDHMDWLAMAPGAALAQEWQAIVDRATPQARVLWRSGGTTTPFVDQLRVEVRGRRQQVGELLQYRRELASWLHERDRVHTYGSFHVADLCHAADGFEREPAPPRNPISRLAAV